MSYVANARMYSVAPEARAAWKKLFAWLAATSDVQLDIIDHAYPASLEALWDRADLGAVFMCGWPFARREMKPRLVAAPIPANVRYGGKPIYFTDFIVRSHSDFRTLADTFGRRLAYTANDSHSGFNAVRHHLASRYPATGQVYADWAGPLVTPRRIVEALLAGEADVGPLDSYAHDLLRRHDPELMEGVRTVESTDPTPIPALVASPGTPDEIVEKLQQTLLSVAERPELTELRDALCLTGFARTKPEDYEITIARAAMAEAAGYRAP